MAEVGHEEGVIEETEKEMIHSIFDFGDTLVREVMVPRPDIVAVEVGPDRCDGAMDVVLSNEFSRLPVYRGDLDHMRRRPAREGHPGGAARGPAATRPSRSWCGRRTSCPRRSRAAELLREMQREQFHLAMVIDEYGSIVRAGDAREPPRGAGRRHRRRARRRRGEGHRAPRRRDAIASTRASASAS